MADGILNLTIRQLNNKDSDSQSNAIVYSQYFSESDLLKQNLSQALIVISGRNTL
jgi:hypothetical protein